MTALSDALAAAQARAVAALAKSYVQGRIDRQSAELMLVGAGLTDQGEDTEQWFASLDVIRDHGAQAPGESRTRTENHEATEAQWKLLRRLADEQKKTAPEGPLTKDHASKVIEQLKAGTYNPDDWTVIPL